MGLQGLDFRRSSTVHGIYGIPTDSDKDSDLESTLDSNSKDINTAVKAPL